MIEPPNDTIAVELKNNLLTVTLNRPTVLNALNQDMINALTDVTQQIITDSDVRVVLLQGAGDNFMAGGDLKSFHEMRKLAPDQATFAKKFEQLVPEAQKPIRTLRKLRQPVLASVRGSVAGYGLSLMNACDMVIAADDAVFTVAYSRIGASPDGGSSLTLPSIIGYRRAFELMALGDRFDGNTALQFGLINKLVSISSFEEATAALAQRLLDSPAFAIGNMKQLLGRSSQTELEKQLSAEEISFVQCASHPDFEEGLLAFFEKRTAHFNR